MSYKTRGGFVFAYLSQLSIGVYIKKTAIFIASKLLSVSSSYISKTGSISSTKNIKVS